MCEIITKNKTAEYHFSVRVQKKEKKREKKRRRGYCIDVDECNLQTRVSLNGYHLGTTVLLFLGRSARVAAALGAPLCPLRG